MRILFTGDLQARVDNLDRCRLVVEQILSKLRSWKGERRAVVFLGDAKDAMNPVDQRVSNFLLEMTQKISAEADFYFIRGNHDSITTQDNVPSCVPIVEACSHENSYIRVADDDWQRFGLGFSGGFIWCVPYFRDSARQKKAFAEAAEDARGLKKAQPTLVRILAFHNEVTGCERNAYSKGTGLTLDEVGIDAYHLCVSGHIHRPQIVFKAQGAPGGYKPSGDPLRAVLEPLNGQKRASYGVIYAGSPFPVDWGEVNSEKSLLVASINEKTGEIKLSQIPSVCPGWYDPSAPGYKPPASWKGTRVRVRVPIQTDQQMEMNAARSRLEKKYPGANLVLIPELQSTAKVEEVDLKGGDQAILRRYLEKVTLPEETTIRQMETFIQKYLPSGGVGIQGIKLGKMSAVNTLCFEKLELDFDQKGLTLVTAINHDWPGSNGGGKTSAVGTPFIALFGRTAKGQTFDGWARQGTDAPAKVEQTVTLADGRKLEVVRTRRPGSLRAFLDDKEISMGKPEATQAVIEKLTGLTWSVLTNAVYVGQREVGSVFGTEKERKELFSRLLGLERFIDAEAKIRKVLLRCKRSVEEVESDISYSEAALVEASSGTLDIMEALASSVKVSKKDLVAKANEVAEAATKKTFTQKSLDALDEWMAENQKAFEKLLFKATDLEVKSNHLIDRRKALSGLQGDCPTCGTRVDVARLEKSVKQLSTQIDALEVEWSGYDEKQQENRTERKIKFEQQQTRKKEWTMHSNRHLAALQELNKMQEQLDARQRLEGILNSKQARVAALTKNKTIHERARLACLMEQQFVEACLAVVCRDGLPAFLASVTAPALNAAAARYSEIFSDGKIGVSFEMSGGEIDLPKIHNEGGGAEFKDQSAGESRMAAIITVFSFMDAMSPTNALVLDEPAEGLDSVNAAAFARGLSKVVERFQHVIIISHSPYILAELEPDREWQVEKRNGVATVKEIQ